MTALPPAVIALGQQDAHTAVSTDVLIQAYNLTVHANVIVASDVHLHLQPHGGENSGVYVSEGLLGAGNTSGQYEKLLLEMQYEAGTADKCKRAPASAPEHHSM